MKRSSGLVSYSPLFCALACLLVSASGCSVGVLGASSHPGAGGTPPTAYDRPRGKLLIILLDETGSFGGHPELWTASVQKAASAVKELNAGDSCFALAITDRGWRSQDVIIPYTTLTPVPLMVLRERSDLMKRVLALAVRPTSSGFLVNGKPINKPPGTDLLGAIDYAAFLAKTADKRAVTAAVFTDLEDEPVARTAGKTLQTWPFWTHIFVLNVRAEGTGTQTQDRITNWCRILNGMKNPAGEDVTSPSDFKQIGQADSLTSFFAWSRR
jgi:hypothetical protein